MPIVVLLLRLSVYFMWEYISSQKHPTHYAIIFGIFDYKIETFSGLVK